MAGVITKATGFNYADYAATYVFPKLGIYNDAWRWLADREGCVRSFSVSFSLSIVLSRSLVLPLSLSLSCALSLSLALSRVDAFPHTHAHMHPRTHAHTRTPIHICTYCTSLYTPACSFALFLYRCTSLVLVCFAVPSTMRLEDGQ